EFVGESALPPVRPAPESFQPRAKDGPAEEPVTGLARGLRGVHRGVRVPDHLVGVRLPGDADRDADGRAYEQLPSPDLEWDRERRQETIRHGASAGLVGIVLQQDPELVAADPRYRVA